VKNIPCYSIQIIVYNRMHNESQVELIFIYLFIFLFFYRFATMSKLGYFMYFISYYD